MSSVQDTMHTMHMAGISQSQIEHHDDAKTFVQSPATLLAANTGLSSLAEFGGRTVPPKAARAFLNAFTDEHRLARKIVERFSTGLKTEKQLRLFLIVLRKYERLPRSRAVRN